MRCEICTQLRKNLWHLGRWAEKGKILLVESEEELHEMKYIMRIYYNRMKSVLSGGIWNIGIQRKGRLILSDRRAL